MPVPAEIQEILDRIHVLAEELAVEEAKLRGFKPGVVTCCVIALETMTFDDDGEQGYRPDYFTTRVGSLAQTLGLISFVDKSLAHTLFCHGDE